MARQGLFAAAAAIWIGAGAAKAADRTESNWTLGAGGVYGSLGSPSLQSLSLGNSGLGLGGVYASPISATASLERRIGRGLWLTLGVSGSGSTGSATVLQGNGQPTVDGSLSSLSFSVAPGLRAVMTPDDAPVEVSVLGEVQVGFAQATITPEDKSVAGQTAHAFRAGVTGGFSVERRLTDALSVRGTAQLIGAFYDRSTAQGLTYGAAKTEGVSFAIGIAPALELRFAF